MITVILNFAKRFLAWFLISLHLSFSFLALRSNSTRRYLRFVRNSIFTPVENSNYGCWKLRFMQIFDELMFFKTKLHICVLSDYRVFQLLEKECFNKMMTTQIRSLSPLFQGILPSAPISALLEVFLRKFFLSFSVLALRSSCHWINSGY